MDNRHIFDLDQVERERQNTKVLVLEVIILGFFLNYLASIVFELLGDTSIGLWWQFGASSVGLVVMVVLILRVSILHKATMYSYFIIPIVRFAEVTEGPQLIPPAPVNEPDIDVVWPLTLHFLTRARNLMSNFVFEGEGAQVLNSGNRADRHLAIADLMPELVTALAIDYLRAWTRMGWLGGTHITWTEIVGTGAVPEEAPIWKVRLST